MDRKHFYDSRMDPAVLADDVYVATKHSNALRTHGQHLDIPSRLRRDAEAWWDARYRRGDQSGFLPSESYWSGQALDAFGEVKLCARSRKPTPGMGVTYCCGSDDYPYTVTRVITERRIFVRSCRPVYEAGTLVEIAEDELGYSRLLTLRPNGRWVEVGQSQRAHAYALGLRRHRMDPSF